MAIKIITPPTAEPVTLAEAKAHCRVTGTDEDSLFTSFYIPQARAMAEAELRRPLCSQTFELTLDDFPDIEINLQTASVTSIVSVKYIASGVEQTIASTNYGLDNADPYESWLIPAATYDWPTPDDAANSVRVRFVAGYGTQADVPVGIKQWMLLHIAAAYENRGALNERDMKPLAFLDTLIAFERVWKAI